MRLLSLDQQLYKGDQGNVQSQTKHDSFGGGWRGGHRPRKE